MSVESRPHGVERPAPCSESLVSALGGPGTQARVLKRELRLDRTGKPEASSCGEGLCVSSGQGEA